MDTRVKPAYDEREAASAVSKNAVGGSRRSPVVIEPHHGPVKLRIIRNNKGVTHGKESDRIPETAGAGGCGESVAPDRTRAWSARPQHHGILQGVQRADAEGRKEHADPGGDYDLRRSFLHFRDEDAADVLLPQAGRENPVRLESAGPRQGRQGDLSAGARDRREEDEGSQLRYRRVGHEDGRGLRPLDGS